MLQPGIDLRKRTVVTDLTLPLATTIVGNT